MSRPIVRATSHSFTFHPRTFRRTGWVVVAGARLWEMTPEGFEDFLKIQREVPRLLCIGPDKLGRPARPARLWAYQDAVWAADPDLDAQAVKGIVVAERMRRTQQINGAKSLAATYGTTAAAEGARPSRQAIPDVVRMAVWTRDGGRCVRCGSTEQLQFDHIIPVARGGGSSVQNLQVLCAPCNHYKHTRITNG